MTMEEKSITDAKTRTDPTLRPRTLFAISGMAMVAGFGGALAISRYRSARAARAATAALRQEASNMAAVANAANTDASQALSRGIHDATGPKAVQDASWRDAPLDPFNPAFYAAKALGIATGIVGAVATVIVVGGIQYGMGIRSMDEFSSRMKLFWGGNFSSLRKAILKNEANGMDEEASTIRSDYGRFKPLKAPPPSSVHSRDESEKDGGQQWWSDLKREMDEDVAKERKRPTG